MSANQFVLTKYSGGELRIGDPITTYHGELGQLTGLTPPEVVGEIGKATIEVNHFGQVITQLVTPATINSYWLVRGKTKH
jgi:hypothetical protein